MTRYTRFISVILPVVGFFLHFSMLAQTSDKEVFAIHPKISPMYNGLISSDSRFAGSNPDCDILKSGSGFGGSLGLFFERKFGDNSFAGLGISYVNRSGKLTKNNVYPIRDTVTGLTPNVTIEDAIDIKSSFIEFQPEFRYTIADHFINGPFRAAFGFRLALPVSPTFEQYREVKSPDEFYFTTAGNHVKKLRLAQGDIKTANSAVYGLSFGLENLNKMSESAFLTEQISFDYNFSSLTSDADIKHFAVRLDFGLRFGFTPAEKIPEPPAPPAKETEPAPIVEKPALAVNNLTFAGKIKTGEEILASLPIVNAVFFPANSSELTEKYSVNSPMPRNWFGGDAVESHKEVLGRIAQIVAQNPSAEIVLEGSTAGAALEPERLPLAQKRAESVARALISLGVPANKITVEAQITPNNPSNQEFPEGVEENRRVDITVKNAPLQEYVAFSQFSILSGELKADLLAENIEDISEIKVISNATERNLPYSKNITIPVERRLNPDETGVKYYVSSAYNDVTARRELTIDLNSLPKENVEKNLNNFNAVLRFSYNSSELTEDNKRLLDQLTKQLPAGSTIEILGSADALGSQERNAALSRERAQATETYIKSISGAKFKIETGVNTHKFDERTPEGRFLSRSIGIRVK